MKLVKAIWILMYAFLLASCGGGSGAGDSPFGAGGSGGGSGGSGGGSDGNSSSITLTLQDASGNALVPPALTGTQNATAVVRLLDSSGSAVPNTLISVSGTGLTLTPSTGQTLTDSAGTARIQLRAADPFASGATTITASGTVSGTAVKTTLDVALGAATAQLGTPTVSATTVARIL